MDPGAAGLSLFNAWRHPAVSMGGMAGMGMDLTQAAYRYNQNMMEYYTCKSELGLAYDSTLDLSNIGTDCLPFQVTVESTSSEASLSTGAPFLTW